MLDLNIKLSSFRKMVWDEEKAKSEEELYNSTIINSNQIQEKKEKLEKDLKASLENRKNFATIRGNEKISKLQEEQKTNFYAYKEHLLNELVSEIKEKLVAYTNTDQYKENLPIEIEKAIRELGENIDDFDILVKKDDQNLISYKDVSTLDDKYLGGFILKAKNGSYQYNQTYLNRLEEKKYDIGRVLYDLFEKESFDESKN